MLRVVCVWNGFESSIHTSTTMHSCSIWWLYLPSRWHKFSHCELTSLCSMLFLLWLDYKNKKCIIKGTAGSIQTSSKHEEIMCKKVCLCLTGVSLSLHGSEPQWRSLHRRRVPLQPSASGYQAADRPLAFSTCGKAEIMEESSAKVPDSSTQDDVPPLGETLQHRGLKCLCGLHQKLSFKAKMVLLSYH